MGMAPPLSSRWKDVSSGIILLIPASFLTFVIGWGIYNIFDGTAKLPGAVFYLVVVGIFDGIFLIPSILLLQPKVILYTDHLRLGYLPISRTRIMFRDLDKMLNVLDGKGKSFFGFVMNDGYRFIIPADTLGGAFIKELLGRLAAAGIRPTMFLHVDESERFLYPKAYEIKDLEKELLERARLRKGQ